MKPSAALVLLIMLLAASIWAGAPHTSGSGLSPAELIPVGPMPYDTPPKLIRGYAPRFPHFEMLRHKSRVAKVVFTIGTDGRTSHLVVEASADSFGRAAIDAVTKWQFHPATKNGEPVRCRMHTPIFFRSP